MALRNLSWLELICISFLQPVLVLSETVLVLSETVLVLSETVLVLSKTVLVLVIESTP